MELLTGRKVEFETMKYGSICDNCGKTVEKRKRMLHVEINKEHGFFCQDCLKDPYHD